MDCELDEDRDRAARNGRLDSVLDSEEGLVAPGGEWRSQLWQTAVRQFDQAADRLALEPEVRVRLLEPGARSPSTSRSAAMTAPSRPSPATASSTR